MRVIWSLASQDDVLDIAEYYDRISPDLADEVVRRMEEAAILLSDYAHIGEMVEQEAGVRKRSVAKTPYVLRYLVEGEQVEVQRLVHAASDWKP